MATTTWESLSFNDRRLLVDQMTDEQLAKRFGRAEAFFVHARSFFEAIPLQTVPPAPRTHDPPKDLVLSARRDLSFFEANFELFDNSVDAWRRAGNKKNLHIEVTYDLELNTGKYVDDAGGLDESDVYKVFIPGETTNRDHSKKVIGSFGMGAKKGIFRLTDGAKIVSCTNAKFSATSQVPERWELSASWETQDGRAKPMTLGRTEIYFYNLHSPPTSADLTDLINRAGTQYRPLLACEIVKKKVEIVINGVPVEAAPGIRWSGAKGASPRVYTFSKVFRDFLSTGEDIPLDFEFTCGLAQSPPGKGADRDEDWGIDVYGNGRLIERFLKKPFGFGVKGTSMQSSAVKYFRGQLSIEGHSFAIPWDTHKREYLADHVVGRYLRARLPPLLKEYATISNAFGADTEKRSKLLEALEFDGELPRVALSDPPKPDELPKWGYGKPQKAAAAKPKGKAKATTKDDAADGPAATIIDGDDDDATVSVPLDQAEFEALMTRFDVSDEDELGTELRECLVNGVAFRLSAPERRAAFAALDCEDVGELSDTIRQQLVMKIKKPKG